MAYFAARDLAVGYHGKALIHDIGVELEQGKILTLIGPNGAGKSTILKSITRHLQPIQGGAYLKDQNIERWKLREFAKKTAVVLTQRIQPELMTCVEVVALGRYPYTGMFGRLTAQDKLAAENALRRVHALELARQDFSTLSDGQRQRVMLARAICQEPELIVLDEPTAYLDIRHKIELLEILRAMSREENITVIMSLHEIDLAMKVSDLLLCVKGDTIAAFGTPEEVLARYPVEQLYDMEKGTYDPAFGSVELEKPVGDPVIFVVAGNGKGIPWFRLLQKKKVPFAAGILYENDVDCYVARCLSDYVVTAPAFSPMTGTQFQQAAQLLRRCRYILDAGTEIGELNRMNRELLALAEAENIPFFAEQE